jgi:hypothetical protein
MSRSFCQLFYTDQVNNWFQHHRRRLRREDSLTRDEILLEQIGEGNKLTEQCVHDEDNDMLLSQATDSVPSLTSQSSIAASILSTGHGDSSLKRRLLGNEAISLDRFPFCELGEVAVHVLIGGYFARCLRGFGGVQVEKPSSSLSLAGIAPAVFCPGFKEVRFASTLLSILTKCASAVYGTQFPFCFENLPCFVYLLAPERSIAKSAAEIDATSQFSPVSTRK